MAEASLVSRRPTRASFKGGRALHDIFDEQGVKWIAKGQFLTEKQVEIALVKGSLTRTSFHADNLTPTPVSLNELKPTFADIVDLTNKIENVDQLKHRDIHDNGVLSPETTRTIIDCAESISELLASNQFSPYKLTGLTSFLYGESSFHAKRPFLKTLNNSGTQHTLFKGIMEDNLQDLVIANLLNPFSEMSEQQSSSENPKAPLNKEAFRELSQKASEVLVRAISKTELHNGFTMDLLRYFTPHLYFTSPEVRLFQQINQYVNYVMPDGLEEKTGFEKSAMPIINFANYFKQPDMGGGLGIEGARVVQYVGLIPPGTSVQFSNREKGVIIAPKTKDILYCVVITGMDGQPLITPSLKEIQFRDLDKTYKVISSQEVPLKYQEHAHEKIWKMHIVHEKIKNLNR